MLQIKFLRRRTPALHIVIFLLISAIILLLARNFYLSRISVVKKQKSEELSVVSKLKIEQISTWRQEKYNAGQMIINGSLIIDAVNRFNNGEKKNYSKIIRWLKGCKKKEKRSSQLPY